MRAAAFPTDHLQFRIHFGELYTACRVRFHANLSVGAAMNVTVKRRNRIPSREAKEKCLNSEINEAIKRFDAVCQAVIIVAVPVVASRKTFLVLVSRQGLAPVALRPDACGRPW